MKLLHIPQFGPAWHAWRRTCIGGSDATILSGTPVPWEDPPTPLSIWKIKTGRAEPQESTFAMRRGTRLEPIIRAAFLAKTGLDSARPWCVAHETHDWLGASLDGLDPWGEWIAEFKAPNLKAHREALEGKVPDYYVPQVQHQLCVTGAQLCYYVSYSENKEIAEADRVAVIEVRPDPALIRRLLLIEHTFWGHVLFDIEPTNDVIIPLHGGKSGEHSGAGSQPENPDRAERTDDRSGAA